jgi:hypothetical protein
MNKSLIKKEPYKQGLLDGLCGFYSIINSFHYLDSKYDQDRAEKLMREMLSINPNLFHKYYAEGTYLENVTKILQKVTQKEKKFKFEVIFEDDFFDDHYEYFACLNEHINEKKVAIISFGPPWHHWSVVTKIDCRTEKIYLFDSADAKNYMNFDEFSLKKRKNTIQLYTHETIIIKHK